MKLKDLEKVINPVYVRLEQKGVAWYEFVVVGVRITWLNSYQNIIEVKE